MNYKRLNVLIDGIKTTKAMVIRGTGISRPALDSILTGNDFKVSNLEKIAKVLEVPVSYFFDEDITIDESVKHYGEDASHAHKTHRVTTKVRDKSFVGKQNYNESELETVKLELEITKDRLLDTQSELIAAQRTAWKLQIENEKLKFQCQNRTDTI